MARGNHQTVITLKLNTERQGPFKFLNFLNTCAFKKSYIKDAFFHLILTPWLKVRSLWIHTNSQKQQETSFSGAHSMLSIQWGVNICCFDLYEKITVNLKRLTLNITLNASCISFCTEKLERNDEINLNHKPYGIFFFLPDH